MDILIKVLQFVASFSLLVLIHEMGHFMFARMFGVKVEKFYLFFNPWFSLWKFNYKGTEYGIGWVPFGGYVKIAGMIDESMDTEQMKKPVQNDEFRAKPAWQRLLIMVGGVMMNIVLAICIYIGMSFSYGDKYISNSDIPYGYSFNEVAKEMGFRDGDKIVSIDGVTIDDYSEIFKNILVGGAESVAVDRAGEQVDVALNTAFTARMLESKEPFLEPRSMVRVVAFTENSAAERAGVQVGDSLVAIAGVSAPFADQMRTALHNAKGSAVEMTFAREIGDSTALVTLPVKVSEQGLIGVNFAHILAQLPVQKHEYSLLGSIPAGFNRTGRELVSYWNQLKMIVSPETEAYKSLGGVIAIGNIFPSFWSWEVFWGITAFLSIVLAVMNILPIPVLDGGHVLFLLYEVVTRRAPSEKFLERAQMVGLVFILALLLYANGNDIYRFFIK